MNRDVTHASGGADQKAVRRPYAVHLGDEHALSRELHDVRVVHTSRAWLLLHGDDLRVDAGKMSWPSD